MTIEREPSHVMPVADLLALHQVVVERGLSIPEVRKRLASDGANEIRPRTQPSPWPVLWRQFQSSLVVLLLAACVLSAVLGDWKDAIAIAAILALNAVQGFRLEYRAEKALAALQSLITPTVRVKREGRVEVIAASELVVGDVVLLVAGDLVPADCRIVEAQSLGVQEAILTGESVSVDKVSTDALTAGTPLAERRNMLFAGTTLVRGRATAVVVETGRRTELGRISGLLEGVIKEQTPLQRKLQLLSSRLSFASVVLVAIVIAESMWFGLHWKESVLLAISTAVAAVPEGLPAAISIMLAVGSEKMSQRKALSRRLSAIETLGAVSVICTDKTGTLTQNQMTVSEVITAENDQTALLTAAVLCCDVERDSSGHWVGDPMEVAIVERAEAAGLDKALLDRQYPRIGEEPFDSVTRRMTTVHRTPSGSFSVTKGALDALLPAENAAAMEPVAQQLVARGLRVIAVRLTNGETSVPRLLGLLALIDPPRPEARIALEQCRRAGIRAVMITGDHPVTARRIAEDLNFAQTAALTGAELEKLSPQELDSKLAGIGVIARVTPEHKLLIVESFQRQKHVVSMTGDGVNDAPALKRADVGVAMGLKGSDAARDAADVVLQDDNFATIVAAVEEGRVIQDNLRKFLRYLLTCNAAEVMVMVAGPLIGITAPLLPVQILWMNLVTDGFPAIALGLERAEEDVMRRAPPLRDDFLNAAALTRIVAFGLLLAIFGLWGGWWATLRGDVSAQSMIFAVLTFGQTALAMALRSERRSVFRLGLTSNPLMLWAITGTVAAQLLILYWPVAQVWMETKSLPLPALGISALAASALFAAVELSKRDSD
jgi:Ca2+-transporting ATPase